MAAAGLLCLHEQCGNRTPCSPETDSSCGSTAVGALKASIGVGSKADCGYHNSRSDHLRKLKLDGWLVVIYSQQPFRLKKAHVRITM